MTTAMERMNAAKDKPVENLLTDLCNSPDGAEQSDYDWLSKLIEIKQTAQGQQLTSELIKCNEEVGRASQKSAEAMNKATEQLATSTGSLKNATWVLVAVTAIQALIAVLAFLKK